MIKKRIVILITALTLLVGGVIGFGLGSNQVLNLYRTNDENGQKLVETYKYLQDKWYFFDEDKKVVEAGINGMTSSNEKDVYTHYFSKEQANKYNTNMESSFVGIGVTYIKQGGYPLITRVFNNSPAQKAGLKAGDKLIKANLEDLKDKDDDVVKSLVTGPEGSSVDITYLRNDKQNKVTINRANIETSVFGKINNGIGYLQIEQFSDTTAKETKVILDDFKANNITKVVIDLRNNPGGLLTSVVDICDFFLDENKIVLNTIDAKGNKKSYKTTTPEKYDFDLAILTNKNTASAAEVMSAALNEHLNVPLIGQTTFGKGTMQEHIYYQDGSMLKFTAAQWLTPNNNEINKIGVKPTIPLPESAIDHVMNQSIKFEKELKYDTVDEMTSRYQEILKLFGYKITRTDGYYDKSTQEAVTKFQQDHKLKVTGTITEETSNAIIVQVIQKSSDLSHDQVYLKAVEQLNK